MEQNIAKRMVTADGGTRITIIRDEWPDNPRYNTDEPLHCEDFSRHYSIMITPERANCSRSSSMRSLLGWLLREYGDHKKVIAALIGNGRHMTDGKSVMDDALVYDRHEFAWCLMCNGSHYNPETRRNEEGWFQYDHYPCTKEYLDAYEIIDQLCDDSIDYLVAHCMTDRVKMASYSFGYNGEVSFSDDVDCGSDGVAWLDKAEFLKYSGCDEDYWRDKSLKDIEFLLDEIVAWADNEVYGFRVEERDDVAVHERNSRGEEKDYVREDWNETDSCWGFYGELSKSLEWMLDQAGLKIGDLTEVAS